MGLVALLSGVFGAFLLGIPLGLLLCFIVKAGTESGEKVPVGALLFVSMGFTWLFTLLIVFGAYQGSEVPLSIVNGVTGWFK